MHKVFNLAGAAFTLIAGYFFWNAKMIGAAGEGTIAPDISGLVWMQSTSMQADQFQISLLAALVAAVCFATAAVLTRLPRDEEPS